jgi:hypothetical protein
LRTNYVLIDFENIQPADVAELDKEHFKVIVFVGRHQPKIPFDLVAALQKMGERARYVKIAGDGKNALDFHISFYIGQIAAKDSDAFFHVVSKDKGFQPLVEHLKTLNIFCARSEEVHEIPLVRSGRLRTPEQRAAHFIEKLEKPGATRARTLKTLRNAIGTLFQNQVPDNEVEAVIAALQSAGVLSIADNRVVYSASALAPRS